MVVLQCEQAREFLVVNMTSTKSASGISGEVVTV